MVKSRIAVKFVVGVDLALIDLSNDPKPPLPPRRPAWKNGRREVGCLGKWGIIDLLHLMLENFNSYSMVELSGVGSFI